MKSKTPNKNSFAAEGDGPNKPLVSARARVISLLSRREHSQAELRAKLRQRGYAESEIEEALQWASLNQFQSDERFSFSLFRRRASTFGDRAISAELAQHGLPGTRSLFSSSDSPSDHTQSEEERAYEWIVRRQSAGLNSLSDPEGGLQAEKLLALKAKVFRGLSSRGFEFGNIDRAWRRILAEHKSNA